MRPKLPPMALAAIIAAAGWGAGQLLNDFLDRASDAINAPDRAIVAGRLPARWALVGAAVPQGIICLLSALQFQTRDLMSRLRAVPVVAVAPPDDGLFRALIVKFCADRQMSADESLVQYLATRLERSSMAAQSAVALLDAEALRLGRPVTRALAAELFRDGAP